MLTTKVLLGIDETGDQQRPVEPEMLSDSIILHDPTGLGSADSDLAQNEPQLVEAKHELQAVDVKAIFDCINALVIYAQWRSRTRMANNVLAVA